MDGFEPSVVIDNGSSSYKAGCVGDEVPRIVFPSIVGEPKIRTCMVGASVRDFYVGDEAQSKRGILKISYPIQNGVVSNWGNMEKLWHYTFYDQLRVQPENHQILLSEGSLTPPADSEKMAEIMFEMFTVPGLLIAKQAVLNLYLHGLVSGVDVCVGENAQVVPVIESQVCPHSVNKEFEITENALTHHFWDILIPSGFTFSSNETHLVRDIRKKLCYVALDFDQEMKTFETNSSVNKTYQTEDGRTMTIGNQLFRCPEVFFQPSLIHKKCPGIHKITHNSVMKCESSVHSKLFSNIVVSGGTSMIPGFTERLDKEITQLVNPGLSVKVLAHPLRYYSTWLGGSKLASSDVFQQKCVSKWEYNEYGPRIIYEKNLYR